MLIDLLELVGLDALAQVDLGERKHRHQDTEALGRMSAQIMLTAWSRLQRRGLGAHRARRPSTLLTQFRRGGSDSPAEPGPRDRRLSDVAVEERPPLITVGLARRRPGWPAAMTRTVLMNAGPWLPVPPPGYGGIENVIATLVPELRRLGVRVVLAIGGQQHPAGGRAVLASSPTGSSRRCSGRTTRCAGCAQAHLHGVVRALHGRRRHRPGARPRGGGRAGDARRDAAPDAPPVLHTLHWDLAKHPDALRQPRRRRPGPGQRRLRRRSWPARPQALREHSVGHVHLSTPLAVDADRRPRPDKGDYAVILGRINPGKGQDVAARLAHRVGFAGAGRPGRAVPPAGGPGRGRATRPGRTRTCGSSTTRSRPHVDGDLVRWVGTVAGQERDDLLAGARAVAVPAALGGAGRHGGGRVAGPGHAGGGDRPGLPARADRARPHRAAHRRRGGAGRPAAGRRPARSGRVPAGGRRAVHPRGDGAAVRGPLRAGPRRGRDAAAPGRRATDPDRARTVLGPGPVSSLRAAGTWRFCPVPRAESRGRWPAGSPARSTTGHP